jgi:hypothetical protein
LCIGFLGKDRLNGRQTALILDQIIRAAEAGAAHRRS